MLSDKFRIFAEKSYKTMGMYINLGNEAFRRIRNSEYVDKSELIAKINSTLFTEGCFTCVTRCRRFGKSMAAKMLCAYYDNSCDSRELFADLGIAKDPSFEKHLNKYPVIYLDMSKFVSQFKDTDIVENIQTVLRKEVFQTYPDVHFNDNDDFMDCLFRVCEARGLKFFFIIDEWDAICREFAPGTQAMDTYVTWLRRMFKEINAVRVFAGVYMTGILPIKKYKTESALNNFIEYSMVSPRQLSCYYGFTKDEVRELSEKYGMDFDELVKWYDGYQIGDQPSMFNPNSVMQAVMSNWCENYWTKTGAYDAVATYISLNYDGLKDSVINMLAGGRCDVNPTRFSNDLSDIQSCDDALTVLIHLGYLAYDRVERQCYIPNLEVEGEMENAVRAGSWKDVISSLDRSKRLLRDTLLCDEEAVAQAIEAAHDENTSILSYNDENSLSCVISLAYYYARNDYIVNREYPSGKGFADIVLIPRKNVSKPAVIIELKKDASPEEAIAQIHARDYIAKVRQHTEDILLVGINYDTKTKQHSCKIEKA